MRTIRKSSRSGYTVIIMLALFAVAIVGYGFNISKLFESGPIAQWAGMEIIRLVGIFVPFVGAFVGYL